MNNGINEQNRLIDTLKRLMGDYGSEKTKKHESLVKKYLDTKFGSLTAVPNQENRIYFFDQRGQSIMKFFPKEGVLFGPSNQFKEIMEVFDLDEDFFEEILKEWIKDNFDLQVKYIDYNYPKRTFNR